MFVIRTYATNTKIKEFLSFLFLFSLFIVYLFTGSLMVLTLWLTIIYFGIYSDHIIKEVFLSNYVFIEQEIPSLSYTIKPERFLYNFRFFYWQNKLPYFFNQEAYIQGYSFEAMDREEFFQHVTIFNKGLEYNKKLEKHFENPKFQKAILSAEGSNKDVKTKDQLIKAIIIKSIKELNKEISEEKKKKTDIKRFTNSTNKRCYHSTPKSYMMDGEDGGRSQKTTSSAGRFVFPTYERPLDLQEVHDALNAANIEVKNGALVDVRRNEEITDVLIRDPHSNTNDLSSNSGTNRRVLIITAENGNPKGAMKFVPPNESFGNNLPATEAAGASVTEAATKSGGAVKQALSKLNWTKGSKRVAVGAAAITGALAMVNQLEDGYAKTQKPGSFYNKYVKPTFEGTSSKPKPSDK